MIVSKKMLEYYLERNLKNDLPGSTNSTLMQNILTTALEHLANYETATLILAEKNVEIERLKEKLTAK